tara:strand:+ start:7681 stop:8367 length:687 start_codon:yes stop_codon:yes gene_type:complete
MKVLDLFSGTQSIKPVCDELGWEYYSLDKYEPSTYQEDILDWDYKNIDIKFDIVWASPCCLSYSNLTHSWRGRVVRGELMTAERLEEGMKEGDKLVKKALEIIDYFKPTYWFIENPDNGRLKNREFMKGLPYYITEYCKWGFDYKKPTRIWTNKEWETKRCRGKTCEMLVPTGKYTKRGKVCMTHKRNLGGQKYGGVGKYITGSNKKQTEERHRVPPKLIHSLFTYKI